MGIKFKDKEKAIDTDGTNVVLTTIHGADASMAW